MTIGEIHKTPTVISRRYRLVAVNFCPHSRLEDMMQTTFTLVVNNAVVRLLIFKKVKCTSLCGL